MEFLWWRDWQPRQPHPASSIPPFSSPAAAWLVGSCSPPVLLTLSNQGSSWTDFESQHHANRNKTRSLTPPTKKKRTKQTHTIPPQHQQHSNDPVEEPRKDLDGSRLVLGFGDVPFRQKMAYGDGHFGLQIGLIFVCSISFPFPPSTSIKYWSAQKLSRQEAPNSV